jgi:hypothetical protein
VFRKGEEIAWEALLGFGIQAFAERVAERIEGENGKEDHYGGKEEYCDRRVWRPPHLASV